MVKMNAGDRTILEMLSIQNGYVGGARISIENQVENPDVGFIGTAWNQNWFARHLMRRNQP